MTYTGGPESIPWHPLPGNPSSTSIDALPSLPFHVDARLSYQVEGILLPIAAATLGLNTTGDLVLSKSLHSLPESVVGSLEWRDSDLAGRVAVSASFDQCLQADAGPLGEHTLCGSANATVMAASAAWPYLSPPPPPVAPPPSPSAPPLPSSPSVDPQPQKIQGLSPGEDAGIVLGFTAVVGLSVFFGRKHFARRAEAGGRNPMAAADAAAGGRGAEAADSGVGKSGRVVRIGDSGADAHDAL